MWWCSASSSSERRSSLFGAWHQRRRSGARRRRCIRRGRRLTCPAARSARPPRVRHWYRCLPPPPPRSQRSGRLYRKSISSAARYATRHGPQRTPCTHWVRSRRGWRLLDATSAPAWAGSSRPTDGTAQLMVSYWRDSRPTPAPVQNLRPARAQPAEQCHRPETAASNEPSFASRRRQEDSLRGAFAGERWWRQPLRHGRVGGIHWHMNVSTKVADYATEPQRQVILGFESRDGRNGDGLPHPES